MLEGFRGQRVTIDAGWRITSITPEAAAWAGLEISALVGADAREQLPMPRALIRGVESSIATGKACSLELPMFADDERWVEFQVHPFASGASIQFQEVTERRLARRAVDSATDVMRDLSEAITAEMLLLDEGGVVLSANAAWRRAFAGSRFAGGEAGVGERYVDVCRQIMPDIDEVALERAIEDLAAGRAESFSQKSEVRTAAGLSWWQMRLIPVRLGGAPHLIAIHDLLGDGVSPGNEAAQRSTAEALLSAQEEERERIAMELHDSTSQHLVALGLGVARLKRLVRRSSTTRNVLDDMAFSVREAVKEIRILSYLMKPPGLERLGLEASARGFVSGFSARTGLIGAFHAEGPLDGASSAAQHAAYRVMQEALSNIYRHSRASRFEVSLATLGQLLTLRVADNGRGIDGLRPGEVGVMPTGVGITSMRTRVAQLGGSLEISCDRGGTIITVTLPSTTPKGPRPDQIDRAPQRLGPSRAAAG